MKCWNSSDKMSRTLAGKTVARRARTPVRMTEGQRITELVRINTLNVSKILSGFAFNRIFNNSSYLFCRPFSPRTSDLTSSKKNCLREPHSDYSCSQDGGIVSWKTRSRPGKACLWPNPCNYCLRHYHRIVHVFLFEIYRRKAKGTNFKNCFRYWPGSSQARIWNMNNIFIKNYWFTSAIKQSRTSRAGE